MQSILLVVHVLLAFSLIGLILIQHGKGADAGAAFGSGASSTVFGSAGSASFLTKATGWLALVFFCNSFFLAYLSVGNISDQSLMDGAEPAAIVETVDPAQQLGEIPELPAEETGNSDLPQIPE